MLKFKDFLNEESEVDVLPVDTKYIENNTDQLNTELDVLTEKPYQNAPIFLAQLRGCLERYGIVLPQEATPYFMNLSTELAYSLGESNLFLYIVYDTNEEDGFVDGYAQAVTEEELNDLMSSDLEDTLGERDPINIRPSTWYAKRDDDSGNSDEY